MNALAEALDSRSDAMALDPDVHAKALADGTVKDLPSNHSPRCAPALDPIPRIGLEAMLTAASAWLCRMDAGA